MFTNRGRKLQTCFKQEKEAIAANLEYDKVVLNTDVEADEKMKILEGWVPGTRKKQIDDFLEKSNILHIIEKARSEERRVGKECRSRWSPYH